MFHIAVGHAYASHAAYCPRCRGQRPYVRLGHAERAVRDALAAGLAGPRTVEACACETVCLCKEAA